MMFSASLLELLRRNARICVLTGAGVSAESGVPTFRGESGLWRQFRPEELATVEAFMANPELVLAWYQHRRDLIDNIQPNPGHHSLMRMERHFSDFTLITQNVDGLHRRAGSQRVIELHGNIMDNKCLKCGRPVERLDFREGTDLPRCACGGLIRPDVVWFGELLPEQALQEAMRKSAQCELFLAVGTSAIVYPAAGLPHIAARNGAYLVEINVQHTELSGSVDELLLGPSGEILPSMLEAAGIA